MPIGLPHINPLLAPAAAPPPGELIAPTTRGIGTAKPAPTAAEIKKAAQDFESLLLNQMIKGLRRTVPEAEPKGHEHQMYQELLDERLAQELSGQGGIGIAEALRRYMTPARPGASPAPGASAPSLPLAPGLRHIKALGEGHR